MSVSDSQAGNLARLLATSVASDPSAPALKLADRIVSYAQLDDGSARVASLLAGLGVGPGDRVGVMLPNIPEFAFCYYGVLRLGAIVVPMNVLLKKREVAYYLRDSGASALFGFSWFAEDADGGALEAGVHCELVDPGGFVDRIAEFEPLSGMVDRDDTDTAVVLYTSGTTGSPKGAELSHANLLHNVDCALGLLGLDGPQMIFGGLPLFHSFGQTCALNTGIASGSTITLLPRFDPGQALEIIQNDRVSVFLGVPTMYGALLNHPEHEKFDLSCLRLCASGGAALPVELLHGFEKAFGCVVLEGYGLSETSPIASFNRLDRGRKPGSIGTPIDGVEMRVVDEQGVALPAGEVGEIQIRGHNVMKGYWQRPDATAAAISADGWFSSGDLAKVDEEGFYFIVDRKKDMIIRGGYNIYPREIEEVLYEHPAVREAAVVGVPHAELGEEVAAAVALKDGSHATAEEIREHVKSQVAAYKYPRVVWFVDDLPKGPTGKILKREIEVPEGAGSA